MAVKVLSTNFLVGVGARLAPTLSYSFSAQLSGPLRTPRGPVSRADQSQRRREDRRAALRRQDPKESREQVGASRAPTPTKNLCDSTIKKHKMVTY